ncbi:hypothetical protein FBU30_010134 [Linnemannia zychae]|nr:hypothetical protein FBU30_010134 [Linnemannia zychae]
MVQLPKRVGFKSHGIHEPLTTRISGILRAYPDSTQIARELLQNSDDACSSVQWYLLDHRDHVKHAQTTNSNLRLFHEDLAEYMGPALLAGNDSVFKEEDFVSLKNLASSEKRNDGFKIGQMGIGFNSIYHLTDCPSFITGDQFMVIEPHERIFNGEQSEFNEGAVRGNFLIDEQGVRDFPDQLRAFAVIDDIDFTKPYNGTIFRLPLRTSKQAKRSSLTKYFRTPEEVRQMLMDLKDEALKALLFLKHVEKIVIYERRADQDVPIKLFEIEIVNASEIKSQRSKMLNRFKGYVEPPNAGYPGDIIEHTVRPIYRMTQSNGHSTEEPWQVTTWIGNLNKARASMLEETDGDENIADHKLIPWVGIAAPLDPSINLRESGLFCFLPIGDMQLPFPVHINGHFAVEQSRRDIWTNFDKKIKTQSSAGIEALWNVHLFEKHIPEAYALFLETLGLDHGANYNLWPTFCGSGIGRDKIWKNMLRNTLQIVLSKDRSVFICGPTANGNTKTMPYSKTYIASHDMDAFPLLKKALHRIVLIADNVPDAILNELRYQIDNNNLPSRILTSARVVQLLHGTKEQWSATEDNATRIEMIKYCLQDNISVDLSGLPLLPLADGSWTEFNHLKSSKRFRVSQKVFRALFMTTNGLINTNLEGYPFDEIEAGCRATTYTYWRAMKPLWIGKKIKKAFQQMIYLESSVPLEPITQIPGQFTTDEWLTDFWNMVGSFTKVADQKKLLSELEGFHLIPFGYDHLAPLLPERSVLFLNQATCKDISVVKSTLEILESRLKCRVLRAIPMDSVTPLYEHLIDASVGPRVLAILSKVDPSRFDELTTEDGETLQRYLTLNLAPRASLDPQQCQALRRLPVFELYLDGMSKIPLDISSKTKDWKIAQGYNRLAQPWSPKTIEILAENQPLRHHLLQILKVPVLSKSEYLHHLISYIHERSNDEWNPILIELFSGYYEHKKRVDFTQLLSQMAFVQVKPALPTDHETALIRVVPSSVASKTLSMFFTDSEAVFPAEVFTEFAFRGPLEELGMMCEFNSDFVERRLSALFESMSCVYDVSHKKAALALYERLNSMFTKKFAGKGLLTKIITLPWLYVKSGELCRPCDCRPVEDMCLVGEQMPLFEFRISNDSLYRHLGWLSPPPLDKVLSHFILLLDNSVSTSNNTTNLREQDFLPIYRYLTVMIDDQFSLDMIKTTLQGRSWIIIHGMLYNVEQAVFKLEYDLSPYYVQLPQSNLDKLFRKLGVREYFNHHDLVALLKSIASNYGNDEPLSFDDYALTRKILTALSTIKSKRYPPDLPVLIMGGSFKPLAEVVFDDRSTRQRSDDKSSQYIFLDESLSKSTATGLGIPMFSVRTLEESKDTEFEPFFQEEKIVDRIRGILRDYDPKGIFNEYLQNASDAGATKFSVLFDTRTYEKDKLLDPKMAVWQGPALLFYNNAVISEDDFSALCKLGIGNKKNDTSKIGYHGLGFNSAYHFTDVPSIFSGHSLVFFDPHMANLPKGRDSNGNPIAQKGHRYDIRKLSKDAMIDQLQPFINHFGCDMDSHFNGTIFRIPLRIKGAFQPKKSSFSNDGWTVAQIQKMFISWVEDTKIGMLFLKNIKTIELFDGQYLSVCVTRHDNVDNSTVGYLNKNNSHYGYQASIVDIKQSEKLMEKKGDTRWLVYTENMLPQDMPQNIQDILQQQHWSRECGIAIPINGYVFKKTNSGDEHGLKLFRGRLMAHMATPIETRFPFHVHGGFALTTNRKTLAGGDADTPENVWNTYLLQNALSLTAIRAYEKLSLWVFRPSTLGVPQINDIDARIIQYFQHWPQEIRGDYAPFLKSFFQYTYAHPVFPCRSIQSESSIINLSGKNVVLKGHIVPSDLESRVFAWLRAGGQHITEIPHELQSCIRQEWKYHGNYKIKQVDCSLLRKRLREDPEFIPRQMKSYSDRKWILEELFKSIEDSHTPIDESLEGLYVVPLLNGQWRPLTSSSTYYIASLEARQIINDRSRLVDSDLLNSLSGKISEKLIKDPSFGIEELSLNKFSSLVRLENPDGIPEEKRDEIWNYLENFPNLAPAGDLSIVTTIDGSTVTLAEASCGIDIPSAKLQEKSIGVISEFLRRLGVAVFDISLHRNHKYLLSLRISYSERRVLDLIVKNWNSSVPSITVSTKEAEFLRKIIDSYSLMCRSSDLWTLGSLPIWKTYGPNDSQLIPARSAKIMTDCESLEHLGHFPMILQDVKYSESFKSMGATPITSAVILQEYVMPTFQSDPSRCIGLTRKAYLKLCSSVVTTAANTTRRNDSSAAKRVLENDQCLLARDGSFRTMAEMFVPGEELTRVIFGEERHRFLDEELYSILTVRRINLGLQSVSGIGVIEKCAQFIMEEIAKNTAPLESIRFKATYLVRYIYNNVNAHVTNWMHPKWSFVPREMGAAYPYDQHCPSLPRFQSFSSLCFSNDRDYIWTQRCFFPQDLVPTAMFTDKYPKVGENSWQERCRHLEVLVKDIAPTLNTAEKQLSFKALIFKIYQSFENQVGKNQAAKTSVKESLSLIMTVPYILNGDDKDPTKSESWVWPHNLISGIDHKIGAHQPIHPSLLKFRKFLVAVGASEMEHVNGDVKVGPKRQKGELEDRIITYFETQDSKNGFMDVKFVFEDEQKSILAHKVILASVNEEIIRQLTGSWSETARRDPFNPAIDVINKKDDYSSFWGLLYFFYTDELIANNGPPTFPVLTPGKNSPDGQHGDTEDQLSQRIQYLMGLQHLANFYCASRLKSLIAQELMLPGKVIYSNVFAIRAHAEQNCDPQVIEYCNKFISAKRNRSLIEKFTEDEIAKVKLGLTRLEEYLGEDEANANKEYNEEDRLEAKEALKSELEDLMENLAELKRKY